MLRPDQIEAHTMKLLKEVGVSYPPVPVEEIAEKLGARVVRKRGGGEISGALRRENSKLVIAVNASESELRQRFTIAHEIGHLRLHLDYDGLYVDEHLQNADFPTKSQWNNLPVFLRDSHSKEAKNPQEIEANRFAAALLMPFDFIITSLKAEKFSVPLREESVCRLSELYEVSQQAMTIRLANLGVPIEVT